MSILQTCKPVYKSLIRFLVAVAWLGMAFLPARAGVMLDLLYQTGYPGGNAVTNLTIGDPNFPASPDATAGQTNGLQDFATGIGSNFGTWMRGWIEAPQTGTNYVFWIASDADSQLWLSTDETTNNRVLICQNVGAVGVQQYNVHAAQKSAPISLIAGQKYYFEVFHTEGSGTAEHCEVAWQLPDGTYESVVLPQHLWAFTQTSVTGAPQPEAPQILTYYQTASTVATLAGSYSVLQDQSLDLAITPEASQPATVQWYSNSVPIPGAILQDYHIPEVSLSANGATYSVIVSNALGTATASTTLSVTADTTPPTLVDAVNLGNPGGDIAVVFSKAVDSGTATTIGNYSITGATITSARMGFTPDTILLQVTGMSAGAVYTVTVNNVRDLPGNTIAPNSTVAIEQNLNTWLPLDESTGPTNYDFSGNNQSGVEVGGAYSGYDGKVSKAVKFNGADGNITLTNGYSNFATNGMTVCVWANPTGVGNWARFIDLGNGPASDNILFARQGTSANVQFEVYKGVASGGGVAAIGVLNLNQWQHFAATLDTAGNVVIYKNGVAVSSGTTAVPNIVTRTECYVGQSDWPPDAHYQGKMDDVRIYNRVLSPSAIMAIANGGGPDDTNNLPTVSIVATVPTTAEHSTPPGVFTVSRTGDTSSALKVQLAIGGTAINGTNYASIANSVTIPAGTNSVQIQVAPIDFSFTNTAFTTVILRIIGATNYFVSDTDSDTVTIQNNDVFPTAILATAENPLTAQPLTQVDVWFAAPVTLPSATTLANYSLNISGINITNAILRTNGNFNLGVTLQLDTPVPTNTMLSVSGVQDASGHTSPSTIPVNLRLTPFNVVANVYHGAAGNRAQAFSNVSDGVVNNANNAGTGFDTWNGTPNLTQFGGMIYPSAVTFNAVKVDLGQQFGDGGIWKTNPFVYILIHPVDPGSTRPEIDTNDWTPVPATLISGSQFTGVLNPNPSPNTPIVYDLSGLPAAQRTGYGWAVGGVTGVGGYNFLSFSELRGYGTPSPTVNFVQQPTNITVTAGQRAIFSVQLTNFLGISYQWYENGNPVSLPTANNGIFTTPQETTADNGAQIYVACSNAVYATNSQTVTLTVLPRTTPPVVVDATIDLFSNIDVWFDEPVDPGTGSTLANYSVSDPALTLTGVTVDAYQTRAHLTFTGAPSVNNPTITVSSVMDTFGNTMSSPQTVGLLPLSWPAQNLVVNQYHQGRATMLMAFTNGIAQSSSTANTLNGDTFGGPLGLSDFAGLIYSQPQTFGVVKVDLGFQFVDGGDWSALPNLYILKSPVDTGANPPETNPNWIQVPATLVSGNIFSWEVDAPTGTTPPPNSPIAFDLSHLPLNQRTGYGWAVGGVPGNARATTGTGINPANEFLSLSELSGFSVPPGSVTASGAPQVILDAAPATQTVLGGFPLIYTVYVTGTQPMTYQWKFNGANLTDNGHIIGSRTNILNLSEVFPSDAGTYQLFITNSAGNTASAAVTLAVTNRVTFGYTNFWTQSGGATLKTNSVLLTDGLTGETRAEFLDIPQYIGSFKATWTYQDIGGTLNAGADGMSFCVQNDPRGPTAIGGGGGGLGVSGISPSVEMEFNLYTGASENVGYTVLTNGLTGAGGANGNYLPTGPVVIDTGDPIGVTAYYTPGQLSLTFTDTVAQTAFTTNLNIDITNVVGGSTAYVGFTGADGGIASKQQISNFQFNSIPVLSLQATNGNAFSFTWPAYVGGFVLQQNSNLAGANWVTVTNVITQANGQNQAIVPVTSGNQFYRLMLQ